MQELQFHQIDPRHWEADVDELVAAIRVHIMTDPPSLHSLRDRVESEIPTLIVTGEFDPQTHRSNGPIVQRSLKNSQLADVPGAAHSGAFDHDCTRTMVRDFLNAPSAKRDMSCLRAIPPPQFVTDVKAISR